MSVSLNPQISAQPFTYGNVQTSPAVMATNTTLFRTTGDILVFAILAECYSANNATASTFQYSVTNNSTATSQTMTGASASLASAPIGTCVIAQLGALANAPTVTTASGVGVFPWGAVRISGNSSITITVGIGSTTGTWRHYIHFQQLEDGASVVAAF